MDTIEVPLSEIMINRLAKGVLSLIPKLHDKAHRFDKYTEQRKLKNVRKDLLDQYSEKFKKQADSVESLARKLTSNKRPIRLNAEDKKQLASVLEDKDISLVEGLNISNINHPQRFAGFPKLEQAYRKKLNAAKKTVVNLTRSDVNVHIV